MNRLILIVALLSCILSMSMNAQDIIVKQNGDVVKGFRVEVTDKAVYYTDTDSDDADIHRINKVDVLVVKKNDGTVINMNDAPQPQPQAPVSAPSSTNEYVISDEQKTEGQRRNNEIISGINSDVIWFKEDPKKEKPAKHILCQFYADETSVFDDGVLQISFDLGVIDQKYNGDIIEIKEADKLFSEDKKGRRTGSFRDAVRPVLTNKSDRMIYVDQALSFFTHEGLTTPYYVPSATSFTEGTTKGGSVNLGGIANAAGVGGALGALAGAVNVGGSKSSAATTVTYAQRILPIPPHSTITLGFMPLHPAITTCYEKPFIPQRTWNANYGLSKLTFYIPKSNPLLDGKSMYFDSNDSPMDWSTYIVYGFDENLEQKCAIKQRMYLSKMLGGSFWLDSLDKIIGYDTPGVIWLLADHRD